MSIIAFIVSSLLLLASIIVSKNKKSISPIVLFFALWTFILFLSSLNLYNIIKPSSESYFLIILMLIFFFLGSMLKKIKENKKINDKIEIVKEKVQLKLKKEEKQPNHCIKPNFIIFYILCFAIILFNIIDLVIIIKESIKGIPMWQIRNWSLEPYGSNNPILDRRSFIEESFRSIILAPFLTIVYPLVAYYFFRSRDKKQRYMLLITSILVLLTSSLAGGGGRLGFIYYFGCFLLSFFIMYKNNQFPKETLKKYSKMVITILILGIVSVTIFTIFRTGIGNLMKQTYTYFALPPTLLSEWLPEIKDVPHTYGMTTFFGIHSYFFRVLDTIGLDFLVPQIYNNTFTHILNAEIFKDVGYGVGNAFVTPIYYFFIDGGYPFVCIASFLFGCIVSIAYEKFEKNMNVRSFTMYTLMMYGIFITFMRIQTAIPAYIISFILAAFILRPLEQQENRNNEEGKENDEKE